MGTSGPKTGAIGAIPHERGGRARETSNNLAGAELASDFVRLPGKEALMTVKMQKHVTT